MLNRQTQLAAASLVVALLLPGCGGFTLRPVTPARGATTVLNSVPIAQVNCVIDPSMHPKQQRVLQKVGAAPEIARVLGISLSAGNPSGAVVNVNLTSVRYSNWGPTRLHGTTQVIGPGGQLLKSFETESITRYSKALKRVAQDFVMQVANNI